MSRILFAGVLCLSSSFAFASGDDVVSHFWHALIPTLFNFCLFAGTLFYFGRHKIKEAFSTRALDIERTVKRNNELYASTLEAYQKYEKLLEGLAKERKEKVQEAHKEGARFIEVEERNAQKQIERYSKESENTLVFEKGKLKQQLMLDLLNMAKEKLVEKSKSNEANLDPVYLSKFNEVGSHLNKVMM